MKVTLRPEDLIRFEEEIGQCFKDKKIRSPIHLYDGCEDKMIEVFKEHVDEDDWCCCSWRSHYQCLLKGVPPNELKESILAGKSISLCFPEYRVISSAIVGGILPIALGIAMSIKIQGGTNKVIAWMGDMTSETGTAHECIKYGRNHKLPIKWIVEDNEKSVCTDTRTTWQMKTLTYEHETSDDLAFYKYSSQYPHAGCGERIQF